MACVCGALARVFRPLTHESYTIKESVEKERFDLALVYLNHKYQGVAAEGIEDTFEDKQWKWSLRIEKVNSKMFWIIPWRRKNKSLELSFRNKYRSRVKSYLAHVQEEGRRIRDEKKKLGRERNEALGSAARVIGSAAVQLAVGT